MFNFAVTCVSILSVNNNFIFVDHLLSGDSIPIVNGFCRSLKMSIKYLFSMLHWFLIGLSLSTMSEPFTLAEMVSNWLANPNIANFYYFFVIIDCIWERKWLLIWVTCLISIHHLLYAINPSPGLLLDIVWNTSLAFVYISFVEP